MKYPCKSHQFFYRLEFSLPKRLIDYVGDFLKKMFKKAHSSDKFFFSNNLLKENIAQGQLEESGVICSSKLKFSDYVSTRCHKFRTLYKICKTEKSATEEFNSKYATEHDFKLSHSVHSSLLHQLQSELDYLELFQLHRKFDPDRSTKFRLVQSKIMKAVLFIDFHLNLNRVMRIVDVKAKPFLSECLVFLDKWLETYSRSYKDRKTDDIWISKSGYRCLIDLISHF